MGHPDRGLYRGVNPHEGGADGLFLGRSKAIRTVLLEVTQGFDFVTGMHEFRKAGLFVST